MLVLNLLTGKATFPACVSSFQSGCHIFHSKCPLFHQRVFYCVKPPLGKYKYRYKQILLFPKWLPHISLKMPSFPTNEYFTANFHFHCKCPIFSLSKYQKKKNISRLTSSMSSPDSGMGATYFTANIHESCKDILTFFCQITFWSICSNFAEVLF